MDQANKKSSDQRLVRKGALTTASEKLSGLRARMLLLALLALVPALLYTVSLIVEQRRMATAAAEAQALRLSRLVAARYESLTEGAAQVLETLAQLPVIEDARNPACNRLLAERLAGYQSYVNLSVISMEGEVLCSARPNPSPVDKISLEHFQQTLPLSGFASGRYRYDVQLGSAVADFAYRLRHGDDEPHAFVHAVIDTKWVTRLAREAALPENSMLNLFDEAGTMLARVPDPEGIVGRATPTATAVRAAVTTRTEGTIDGMGLDGVMRLYAYVPIVREQPVPLYVAVGLPHDFLYASVEDLQRKTLIGVLLVALVLLLIIDKAADWLVLRHVHALLRTSRRLGAGELSARTGIPPQKGEIFQLAQTFDEMAAALQAREAESRRAQEALAQSEARFRRLAENAPDVIYRFRIRPQPGHEYVSPAVTRLYGYMPEEFYADPDFGAKIVHPDDRTILSSIARSQVPETVEMRMVHRNGSIVWTEQHNVPVYDAEGNRVALEGIARDITARKQREQELHLLQSITLAVSEAEDMEAALSIVMRAVCEATGWVIGQAWVPATEGGNLFVCSPAWYGRERGLEPFRAACEHWVVDGSGNDVHARVVRERVPLWLRDIDTREDFSRRQYAADAGLKAMVAVPVTTGAEIEAVMEFFTREPRPEDEPLVHTVSSVAAQLGAVIRRKRSEERLMYLAHHDVLTDLPNRALFSDRLRQALFEANRQGRLVAVAFLDLDRFKNINDSLGHETGDQLLRGVADRLRANIRETDTVARISGDEFMLVLPGLNNVDDASRIAQKILASLSQPLMISGHELYVSASLGIAIYPHDAKDVEGLLRNADVAMYRAKETGRNAYQFYTAEMTVLAQEHLQLEGALRRALDRDEFTLHFQPILDLASGTVVGAEALLRWMHPERGIVEPGQFVHLAEEAGLIAPIGEWALRSACNQFVAWDQQGLGPLRLSVNISPRQFQSLELADTVATVLRESGMAPERLELELTEGVLLHNPDSTIANMDRLSAMGVRLSIDDFGTGYSSLTYIKQLPIDELKIDRSFVCDIPGDEDDAAIATAIIAMAHNLKLTVVAEGVETLEQLAFLRNHRCDLMQGNYFSRPLPAGEFAALLREGRQLALPATVRAIRGGGPPRVES
jgi:diguanylate cyclase (GGDEF)-like protein/PAS domain S-box-containing protein